MSVSTTATIGPGGAVDALVVHAREIPRTAAHGVPGEHELDHATGLMERSAFDARLRRALSARDRGLESCGLVLVDVSDVRRVGETLGRSTDATILRSLSNRLQHLARAIDVAGRVDDDHVALLLGAVRGHGEVARIAAGVCESLAALPVPTAGGDVSLVVRCGAAVGERGDEPIDLIERAAAAMRETAADRDDAEDSDAAEPRRSTSLDFDDLRVALSLRGIRPYAQRVVDLRSGPTVGYRGTSRWHHTALGVLDAGDFVGMVAGTPLASQLDLCVARELAEVLALSIGDDRLRLYTPVSTQLIADVRAEQYLTEIAQAFHLSTEQIRLQVARPLLDRWSRSLQDALGSLREAGFGFVLTGVAEVSDVRSVVDGFDEVHLSRALTRAVATDSDSLLAASQVIRAAHEQDVVVGANGVDTESIRAVLVDAGCDVGSGDLYGAAEPARELD